MIAAVVVFVRRRSRRRTTGRPVAHTGRLTGLTEYRAAARRYRALLTGAGASALLVLLASVVLSARPASTEAVAQDLGSRDIVLCLDVSGSMVDYDAAIVGVFDSLAKEFDGERVSLVVFNASAVTYFPLTSDYRYMRQEFDRISTQFTSDDADYFDGTFIGDGSSLVGDGLAACALRFDTPEVDRSRSIILATDNLVVGRPIFTLPEAAAVATDQGITVYGINPGDTGSREYLEDLAVEFQRVVESTGGAYYPLGDADAIPEIVESIGAEQAVATSGTPVLIERDRPAVALVIAFLGLAGLMLSAWRARR